MKKILIIAILLISLTLGLNAQGYFIEGKTAIKATAQNFTAAWVDIGIPFQVKGYSYLTLWTELDINGSTDCQIRVLVLASITDTVEYQIPIRDVTTTVTNVSPHYFEYTSDADQKLVLPFKLIRTVYLVQVQIKAGTLGGGTAAQMDSLYFTLGSE